jgi:hypothetical protein
MMAEMIRKKEDELTTADLARRTANIANPPPVPTNAQYAPRFEEFQATDPRRPRLVQSEPTATASEVAADTEIAAASETDARYGNTPSLADLAAQRTNQATHDPATVTPLFSETDIGDLRSRWSDVQAGFVDEPRRSVEQADQLVATVIQRLAERFANERATLERQWEGGDNVSTEDLRVALQRYRSFFGRLLNAA